MIQQVNFSSFFPVLPSFWPFSWHRPILSTWQQPHLSQQNHQQTPVQLTAAGFSSFVLNTSRMVLIWCFVHVSTSQWSNLLLQLQTCCHDWCSSHLFTCFSTIRKQVVLRLIINPDFYSLCYIWLCKRASQPLFIVIVDEVIFKCLIVHHKIILSHWNN